MNTPEQHGRASAVREPPSGEVRRIGMTVAVGRRVALVAAAALLGSGCGGGREATLMPVQDSPSAAAGAWSASARDPRVAVDGSRVVAVRRVQQVEGRVRLCSPDMVEPAIGRPPGYVAPPCWAGVWVEGLDTAAAGPTVRVTGVLRGDTLDVESQENAEPDGPSWGLPPVPCEPPPGGWPEGGAPFDDRNPDDAALIRFNDAHPDLAAGGRVLLLRPARDRQVVAVVVRDEAEKAAIEAELAADFPGRTCIVVQDGDPAVASEAQNDPRLRQERLMMSAGTQWLPGLRQKSAHASVVKITERMLEAEADYPPGTLVLEPFLRVAQP
jgi:hypothetical protein